MISSTQFLIFDFLFQGFLRFPQSPLTVFHSRLYSSLGMKLFRSTSRLLIAAARYMASRIGREDLDDQYKSYKLFLRVLTRALTGEYTNLGIFEV